MSQMLQFFLLFVICHNIFYIHLFKGLFFNGLKLRLFLNITLIMWLMLLKVGFAQLH